MHTQTTITAPVSTTDVSAVLAVASHNVGYLCSNAHGKINKWSKYKPVDFSEKFPLRTGEWWRGSNKKCGLTPVYVTDHRNIPGKYTETFIRNGWAYTPPKGDVTSPYRMGDFDRYMHNARPPIFEFSCIEKACRNKLFWAGCSYNPVSAQNSPTSVGLADIEDDSGSFTGSPQRRVTLNDYYFGIVICKPDGSILQRQTADKPGDVQIRITNFSATLNEGQTYTVYPFISLKKLGLMDPDQQNNYLYPLPCVRPATFKAVSAAEYAGLVIDVSGKYTLGKTGAQVSVRIASSKVCSFWGTLRVRHTAPGEQTDVYDKSIAIASSSSKISIPADGKFEKEYDFILNEEYYGQYMIHLVVTIDNVLYEKTGALMVADIGGGAL